MIHLAVLGSTKGTDLQAIIDAIKAKQLRASIEVVISNKADAYILERAHEQGLNAILIESKGKTREAYDAEVLNELKKYQVDLVLLIGYMRILSPEFVRAFPHKIINVHPSLLPAFAGGMDINVHEEVLKAGVKETGCTIHYVDEGVDTGEIIMQKKYTIAPGETVESLKQNIQKLEGEAFVEVIRMFSK
jgi:phosphoribosylglycinamide formyltransferase-1